MGILFADFETRSKVDLKKSGADPYARDPSTRVMAFGYAFDDEDVLVSKIGEIPEPAVIDHIQKGLPVVAHNAPFEWVIWNHVYRREFPILPELKVEQLICTMARAYSMALPGALEKVAPALGLDVQKDMQGRKAMLSLCKPDGDKFIEPEDDPAKFERMYKYCAVDVGVERLVYKRCLQLSSKERALWELDHKINQRGIKIDLNAAQKAIELVAFEQERLDYEMVKVTKGAVCMCTAVGQLTDWLKWKGVEVESIGKKDLADLLETTTLPDDCRKALLLRQEAAKSSNAKLNSMLTRICEDGRIRSTTQYHAAGTGRWAGRGIQVQNFPRPRISQNEIEQIFGLLSQ